MIDPDTRAGLLRSVGAFIAQRLQVMTEQIRAIDDKAERALARDMTAQIELAVERQARAHDAQVAELRREIDLLRARPEPEAPEPVDVEALAAEVLRRVPDPVEPDPVELPDIEAMVRDAVDKAVAEMPAAPTVDEVLAGITIPQPEPLPDIKAMIIESLPAPVEPEPVDEQAIVDKVLAGITLPEPPPVELPDIGAMVDDAVSKAVAEMPQAKDGRDALEIEILPEIDLAKNYPRGTFAKHKGGLWRAYQTTTGMHGWECLVDGIAGHEIRQLDDRTFEAESVLSSGAKASHTISVPVVLDQGTYKADQVYAKGDGVTWGGSFWIAQDDVPTTKPGEDAQWRLAVKRGRDGRHGTTRDERS